MTKHKLDSGSFHRWKALRRFLPVSQAGQLHIISGYAFAWLVLLHVACHITGNITASRFNKDAWIAAGLTRVTGGSCVSKVLALR